MQGNKNPVRIIICKVEHTEEHAVKVVFGIWGPADKHRDGDITP